MESAPMMAPAAFGSRRQLPFIYIEVNVLPKLVGEPGMDVRRVVKAKTVATGTTSTATSTS